jgi:hypothetical protein
MAIYAGNGKVVETKYGGMMKLSLMEQDVLMLQQNLKDGWVNASLKKRKEPSKGGFTHYLQIDEYVRPVEVENNSGIPTEKIKENREKASEDVDEILPF